MKTLDINQIYIKFEDKIKVPIAFSNIINGVYCKKNYNIYGLKREITYVGFSTTVIGGRIKEVEKLGKLSFFADL